MPARIVARLARGVRPPAPFARLCAAPRSFATAAPRRAPAAKKRQFRALNQQLSDATSTAVLLQLHAEHGAMFNQVNMSTCWNRLSRAYGLERVGRRRMDWDRELEARALELEPLRQQTLATLPGWQEQGLANLAHALAKLGLRGPGWTALWGELAAAAAQRSGAFTTRGLATVVYSLAVAGKQAPALFDVIAEETTRRAGEFSEQELANTAWAFAKVGRAIPGLFDAIAAEAMPRVRGFSSQGLVNLAWAFATIGHQAPALFDAIAAEAMPRVREFNTQGLANLARAFAKAGCPAPALFDAIAAEAPRILPRFSEQGLASLAWAYASAGHPAPALFDAIAAEAPLATFTEQGLTSMLWAYASARHTAPELFDAVAKLAPRRVGEFNAQCLTNLAWAYATAGHPAPELFDTIAEEAPRRMFECEFDVQELARMAWAYATAGRAAPALLDTIAAESVARLDEFDAQSLSNLAWAFAVANRSVDSFGLFDDRFARRCDAMAGQLDARARCQMHQWALWHAVERGRAEGLPSGALLEQCREAFARSSAQPSGLQRQVGASLRSLDLSLIEEYRLAEGYSLDYVVLSWRIGTTPIAVEVDGPRHFWGREPTGATLLKRRQLGRLGWPLVSVPYWEWAARSPKAQRDYLSERLDSAAIYMIGVPMSTPPPR